MSGISAENRLKEAHATWAQCKSPRSSPEAAKARGLYTLKAVSVILQAPFEAPFRTIIALTPIAATLGLALISPKFRKFVSDNLYVAVLLIRDLFLAIVGLFNPNFFMTEGKAKRSVDPRQKDVERKRDKAQQHGLPSTETSSRASSQSHLPTQKAEGATSITDAPYAKSKESLATIFVIFCRNNDIGKFVSVSKYITREQEAEEISEFLQSQGNLLAECCLRNLKEATKDRKFREEDKKDITLILNHGFSQIASLIKEKQESDVKAHGEASASVQSAEALQKKPHIDRKAETYDLAELFVTFCRHYFPVSIDERPPSLDQQAEAYSNLLNPENLQANFRKLLNEDGSTIKVPPKTYLITKQHQFGLKDDLFIPGPIPLDEGRIHRIVAFGRSLRANSFFGGQMFKDVPESMDSTMPLRQQAEHYKTWIKTFPFPEGMVYDNFEVIMKVGANLSFDQKWTLSQEQTGNIRYIIANGFSKIRQ